MPKTISIFTGFLFIYISLGCYSNKQKDGRIIDRDSLLTNEQAIQLDSLYAAH